MIYITRLVVLGIGDHMEKLQFQLDSNSPSTTKRSVICGVVGSGNLEILVTKIENQHQCVIEVNTSATGFEKVWYAVLNEFSQRYAVNGYKFQLNDMGATPAVVSLRLSQAVVMLQGAEHE